MTYILKRYGEVATFTEPRLEYTARGFPNGFSAYITSSLYTDIKVFYAGSPGEITVNAYMENSSSGWLLSVVLHMQGSGHELAQPIIRDSCLS